MARTICTTKLGVAALALLSAVAASVVMVVTLASPAWADTTFTVNSDADTDDSACTTASNGCTLREAINAANAGPGGNDEIVFDLGQPATITIGSTLPPITDASGLTIDGQNASITISGNEQVRVFEVVGGAELALLNLTVADGFNDEYGGGLFNSGTVKAGKTTFSNNSTPREGAGGGIFNETGGNLTVTNSTFSENRSNSTHSNDSTDAGGGIFNNVGGNVTVTNSTFSNNSADRGGGIWHSTNGTLTVTDSTFSNNSADRAGGGVFNLSGTLAVTNSTFSENSGGTSGGGIYTTTGTLTVTDSTFSNNSAGTGGGIFSDYGLNTLRNTIVANSTSGGNCDGQGTFAGGYKGIIDGGYNIDDATTCGFSEQQDSLPSTDPLLADQPANNGGLTLTHALLEGSPAIDKGDSFGATTDQRGSPRPSDFANIENSGDGSDIGAFELQVPDQTAPLVSRVEPRENATGIGPGTNVRAFFSEAMMEGSIDTDTVRIFKAGEDSARKATVTYEEATNKARLDPSAELRRGDSYRVVVNRGARDEAGNRLDQDQDPSNGHQKKVWRFKVMN